MVQGVNYTGGSRASHMKRRCDDPDSQNQRRHFLISSRAAVGLQRGFHQDRQRASVKRKNLKVRRVVNGLKGAVNEHQLGVSKIAELDNVTFDFDFIDRRRDELKKKHQQLSGVRLGRGEDLQEWKHEVVNLGQSRHSHPFFGDIQQRILTPFLLQIVDLTPEDLVHMNEYVRNSLIRPRDEYKLDYRNSNFTSYEVGSKRGRNRFVIDTRDKEEKMVKSEGGNEPKDEIDFHQFGRKRAKRQDSAEPSVTIKKTKLSDKTFRDMSENTRKISESHAQDEILQQPRPLPGPITAPLSTERMSPLSQHLQLQPQSPGTFRPPVRRTPSSGTYLSEIESDTKKFHQSVLASASAEDNSTTLHIAIFKPAEAANNLPLTPSSSPHFPPISCISTNISRGQPPTGPLPSHSPHTPSPKPNAPFSINLPSICKSPSLIVIDKILEFPEDYSPLLRKREEKRKEDVSEDNQGGIEGVAKLIVRSTGSNSSPLSSSGGRTFRAGCWTKSLSLEDSNPKDTSLLREIKEIDEESTLSFGSPNCSDPSDSIEPLLGYASAKHFNDDFPCDADDSRTPPSRIPPRHNVPYDDPSMVNEKGERLILYERMGLGCRGVTEKAAKELQERLGPWHGTGGLFGYGSFRTDKELDEEEARESSSGEEEEDDDADDADECRGFATRVILNDYDLAKLPNLPSDDPTKECHSPNVVIPFGDRRFIRRFHQSDSHQNDDLSETEEKDQSLKAVHTGKEEREPECHVMEVCSEEQIAADRILAEALLMEEVHGTNLGQLQRPQASDRSYHVQHIEFEDDIVKLDWSFPDGERRFCWSDDDDDWEANKLDDYEDDPSQQEDLLQQDGGSSFKHQYNSTQWLYAQYNLPALTKGMDEVEAYEIRLSSPDRAKFPTSTAERVEEKTNSINNQERVHLFKDEDLTGVVQ